MQNPPTIRAGERDEYEPAPHPDPEHPRDEHASHAWTSGPRWRECSACGVRDYWPSASVECSGAPPSESSEVTLAEACAAILADLAAFRVWWNARPDLGAQRPSFAEWRAEFLEWAKVNGHAARAEKARR